MASCHRAERERPAGGEAGWRPGGEEHRLCCRSSRSAGFSPLQSLDGSFLTRLVSSRLATKPIRGNTHAVADLDATGTRLGRGISRLHLVPAQAPRLAGLLAQARAGGADLVLIDTPPEADGIASAAAAAADLTLIPCRPSALDLDAVAASVRIAATTGRPFAVAINAAPVVGVEVAEMRAALAGAGVPVAPVVLHQRKAFSSRMQEGRTAGEHEPGGKAAAELTALFRWLCQQVRLLPDEQPHPVTGGACLQQLGNL